MSAEADKKRKRNITIAVVIISVILLIIIIIVIIVLVTRNSSEPTAAGCSSQSDCPPSLVCNTSTNKCVPCINDTNCTNPGLPKCDLNRNVCLQCLTLADCPDGEICKNSNCRIPCTTQSDCISSGKTCDVAQGICL
jgi:hypothetical protein